MQQACRKIYKNRKTKKEPFTWMYEIQKGSIIMVKGMLERVYSRTLLWQEARKMYKIYRKYGSKRNIRRAMDNEEKPDEFVVVEMLTVLALNSQTILMVILM